MGLAEQPCFKYDWCTAGKDMWLWDVPLYLLMAWGAVCAIYFLGWFLVLLVKVDVAWAGKIQEVTDRRIARRAVEDVDQEYEALVAGEFSGGPPERQYKKPTRIQRLYEFIDWWVDR